MMIVINCNVSSLLQPEKHLTMTLQCFDQSQQILLYQLNRKRPMEIRSWKIVVTVDGGLCQVTVLFIKSWRSSWSCVRKRWIEERERRRRRWCLWWFIKCVRVLSVGQSIDWNCWGRFVKWMLINLMFNDHLIQKMLVERIEVEIKFLINIHWMMVDLFVSIFDYFELIKHWTVEVIRRSIHRISFCVQRKILYWSSMNKQNWFDNIFIFWSTNVFFINWSAKFSSNLFSNLQKRKCWQKPNNRLFPGVFRWNVFGQTVKIDCFSLSFLFGIESSFSEGEIWFLSTRRKWLSIEISSKNSLIQ